MAAGIGLNDDDTGLPCLTVRMWVIGIAFCILGSGINTLYTFRFPGISLSQSAIQFLAYPVGRAWEYVIPDWGFNFRGKRISLNPGRFNYKVGYLGFQVCFIEHCRLTTCRRTSSSTSSLISAS